MLDTSAHSDWLDPTRLLLSQPGRLVADAPALMHSDWVADSLHLAGVLAAHGAQRVALWFDDAADFACALLACWRAGVIAVLPSDVLPHSRTRLDAEVDAWLSNHTLDLPPGRQLDPRVSNTSPLSAEVLDEQRGGVLVYTSGSSGVPKAIPKRWQQLADEVRALQQHWPRAARHTVLGSVGMFHMYGLPFRVLWPLCAGHLLDRPQRHYPEELAAASLRHDKLIWIASPALLRRVGERIDWSALRGRLQAVYSAGGPLPADVSDMLAERSGCRPIEIYGSSETGAIATRQGQASWTLLPGVELGQEADGALWVDSPWTAAGRERTADAGIVGPEGLQLLGRVDRVVKLEEKRIGLASVETALLDHPWVREARVGLNPSHPRLSAVLALSASGLHTLRNGGRRALLEALRTFLQPHLEPLAIPRVWRLVHEIPWSAQGKLSEAQFMQLTGPRPTQPDFAPLRPESDGAWRTAFRVPLDLAHFSGHFPSAPVVPGVALLGWAIERMHAHLLSHAGIEFEASGVENLKFQRLVRPGDDIELTLRWDAARHKFSFSYQCAEQPCASGRVVNAHAPAV